MLARNTEALSLFVTGKTAAETVGYDFKEEAQDENRFAGCFWDYEGMWSVHFITLDIIIRGID